MVTSQSSFFPSHQLEIVSETPIAELIEERITKPSQEAFIDKGLEIPDSYDVDTIRAMLQDPFHIWVYWNVRPQVFDKLKAVFPQHIAESFSPVLKVTELTFNDVKFINILESGDYWLSVLPDKHYHIEVGMLSSERGYIRLLEADEITTPRGTISTNIDPEPEYKIAGQDFADNLRASGFAAFAGMLGPERVMNALPENVSSVLSTVSAGESLQDDQINNLPPRIRALLKELQERGEEGDLTLLAFLYLIPEYLRESVAEVEGLFADALHPHHVAPRYMVGSSEHRPYPSRNPWLPSMTNKTISC